MTSAVTRTDLRGARIVVTGGHGFLGGHVSDVLRERGADVVALGSADYDLREQSAVRALYADLAPDQVVHVAAAVGGIGANVANPGRFLYENAVMGLMLLEEGRRAGLGKFVLASTTCTYATDAPLPLREDDIWSGPPAPATGAYGMAKRLLHEACETYHRQYDVDSAVLVLSNLYGPRDHFDGQGTHVLPALIRRYADAVREDTAYVSNWGSGRATREFLHVRDGARAVALACETPVGPAPINVGTGIETSIAELAALVQDAVGYTGEVRWDTSKPEGQPTRYSDVTRARELLGFSARVPLADGVRETVDWFLAQQPVEV
ncbi:NAD-dependent epimerase/dehydratase family protein [Allobranchiibius huperziae]|uniref:GDP-L-fucose synthase n=1 Tax=Allobranchiibius huperziae TaxID=1874116 RepID=A0A853DP34_9MICO|nr:GDP-L-fucose synthase [Allobranchiibius huperziae]